MGTYVVKLSCGSWLQDRRAQFAHMSVRKREQVPERSSCLAEAIRTRDEQIHALSEDRRGLRLLVGNL